MPQFTSKPAYRVGESRGLATDLAEVERAAIAFADYLALLERGAGIAVRRASALRARVSPLMAQILPRSRTRAQHAHMPADRFDESRGLAAEYVEVERAPLARADDLALIARGAGCRRSPRGRSLHP